MVKPFRTVYREVQEYKTSYTYDLDDIKRRAKEYGVTISSYLLAVICTEFLKERDKMGSRKLSQSLLRIFRDSLKRKIENICSLV